MPPTPLHDQVYALVDAFVYDLIGLARPAASEWGDPENCCCIHALAGFVL